MFRTVIQMTAVGALCAGVYTNSAQAADLGGACCGDLEERVAELEATVARKGNRVVSLKISGYVARELAFWDDGDQSDVYIVDPSTTLASHFKFSGEAQMMPGWKAGYALHIEVLSPQSLFVDQTNDDGGATGLNLFYNNLYVESERLGRVTIGQQSQASDNAAILADFSGSLLQANTVLFDGASFFLRPEGTGLSGVAGLEGNIWGSLGFCQSTGLGIGGDCNGVPLDAVRYDTPTFYGFSASTSWGENDFWDVAARYQGDFNSIRLKAITAYSWNGDHLDGQDAGFFQAGAMVMHVPTGLWIYGAYGQETVNEAFIVVSSVVDALQEVPDNDHWYLKAGVRRQWNTLGNTVIYGEYGQYNDMFGGFDCGATVAASVIGAACATGITVTSSEISRWGAGVVQEIDAASMSMWAKYVQLDADVDFIGAGGADSQDYETLRQVVVGIMINF